MSLTARRIYFVCALLAISLPAVFIATRMALDTSGISAISAVPIAALVVRWLVFPGILGTAVLSVAMWYFWFSFDRSSWGKKMMWFLPLYLLVGIGPVLYYFFVYRSSQDPAQPPTPAQDSGGLQGSSLL